MNDRARHLGVDVSCEGLFEPIQGFHEEVVDHGTHVQSTVGDHHVDGYVEREGCVGRG